MTSNLIFSLNSILLFHESKYNKRATGLNGHLSSRDSTLTSCQNGSYYISMNHHRTNNKSTMVKENCIITPCNIITKNVLFVYTRHKNHTYFHPLHPNHNPTYEWCHEIYTFDKSYPGHPYYVLSLSDPCLGPNTTSPCTGGHEIYNLGRPFHSYPYYILSLSDIYS